MNRKKSVSVKRKKKTAVSRESSPTRKNVLGLDLMAYVRKKASPVINIDYLPPAVRDEFLAGRGIHAEKFKAAYKGIPQHYEWVDTKHGLFLQTNLLPLPKQKGTSQVLLATVRDITFWASQMQAKGGLLQEVFAHHTFSQLLLAAREEEKKHLSKALHDEIGSAAVILTALLSLVRASLIQRNAAQALIDLKELDFHIKRSIERIKNIVVSLRPPTLEQEGSLTDALRELLKNIGNYARVTCAFSCATLWNEKGISDNVKILLYRVVQEALNNVAKHAHAKHVWVNLKREKDTITLCVEDDGVGFRQRKQIPIRHIGLLAMKDSVHFLGGKITIKSSIGKGTSIQVECPCMVYEDRI